MELDCWPSGDGEDIVITHGGTLCGKVSFKVGTGEGGIRREGRLGRREGGREGGGGGGREGGRGRHYSRFNTAKCKNMWLTQE